MDFTRAYHRGFTLAEVIIIIAIIGLLASVAYFSFDEAKKRARDAERISDLRNIQAALRLYVEEEGEYPDCPNGDVVGQVSGPTSCGSPTVSQIDTLIQKFISPVPRDPGSAKYIYDSEILCETDGYSEPHIVLFVTGLEQNGAGNWDTVCKTKNNGSSNPSSPSYNPGKDSLPSPGKPTDTTYGIILK